MRNVTGLTFLVKNQPSNRCDTVLRRWIAIVQACAVAVNVETFTIATLLLDDWEQHSVPRSLIQSMMLQMIYSNRPTPPSLWLIVAMTTEMNELVKHQHAENGDVDGL